ncbi:enhanced serine sensitivity protein SseB C-terminal domain-containing protein, partial [Hafnia alvei]
ILNALTSALDYEKGGDLALSLANLYDYCVYRLYDASHKLSVDGGSKILLGQPEEYPSAMVDALTTLFTQRKIVRNAYLAIFQDQAIDEKPNLLIGLEIDGTDEEIDLLIQETGSLASETAPEDEPVDLCLVTDEKGDAVSHYLKTHTQPFYQRRWGSWLRNSIPSSGTA